MYYPTIRGRGTYLSSSKPYTPGQEKSAASSKPWIIYNHLRPLHYNYCFMKPTFDFIRYDYFCILYRTRGTRINGGRSSGIWSPDWYTRSPCQLLSYLQKGPLLCLDIGFGFDFVLAVRRGNLCPINRFVVKGFFSVRTNGRTNFMLIQSRLLLWSSEFFSFNPNCLIFT